MLDVSGGAGMNLVSSAKSVFFRNDGQRLFLEASWAFKHSVANKATKTKTVFFILVLSFVYSISYLFPTPAQ